MAKGKNGLNVKNTHTHSSDCVGTFCIQLRKHEIEGKSVRVCERKQNENSKRKKIKSRNSERKRGRERERENASVEGSER